MFHLYHIFREHATVSLLLFRREAVYTDAIPGGGTVSTFSVTFGNVLLTLMYLSAGFLLSKAKKVIPDHMSSISSILLYICAPCMFLDAIISLDYSASMTANIFLFLVITLAVMVLALLLIFLLLGRRRKDFAFRMMAIASVMGNVGFFGLPVVRAVFPEAPEAAAYSCIFCVSMNIVAWTLCVFILTDDRKYMSVKASLLNPTVLPVTVALVLYASGAKNWMPQLVLGGIHSVGGISTPLCMFILGIRLSTMNLKSFFTSPVPWLASFGKLLAFPLISYGIVLLLPLSDVFRASILLLSATPCASIILNLSEIHHHGQDIAARCALLSTLLSVLTIPLLSLLL